MPAELHIIDGWRGVLVEAGLDTLAGVMRTNGGTCVSHHVRGQAYRIVLADGRVIFLKRDCAVMVKDILADLWRLRRPEPPCINELRAIRAVGRLGVAVPEVVAWGQRRRAGLPSIAALVTRPLAGMPVDEFLQASPPESERHAAMHAAGVAVAKIYASGLSWPDLLPKHVFLDGHTVGVLDLARMRPVTLTTPRRMDKQVLRFCGQLLAVGGDEGDRAAFLNALHGAGRQL